ncbi:MAG TPA: hypothetical protein VMG63_23035, partial [Terriglobia bacterium]|nr:hypothetical protein [Terriglobia bacterium]
MRENPLASFPLPRLQPYRPYVFSPGELRRFFDYLQQRIERAAHARALYRAHCHYTLIISSMPAGCVSPKPCTWPWRIT